MAAKVPISAKPEPPPPGSASRAPSGEEEHHRDHQRHGDDQRLLYLPPARRGWSASGPGNFAIDRGRNGSLKLRRRARMLHRLDDVAFRQLADVSKIAGLALVIPALRTSCTESVTLATPPSAPPRRCYSARSAAGIRPRFSARRWSLPAVGGIFQRPAVYARWRC